MSFCRISGQEIHFPFFVPELTFLGSRNTPQAKAGISFSSQELTLSRRATGWVAGAQRRVETWFARSGILLKVSGGCNVYIALGGQDLIPLKAGRPKKIITGRDREILLGPALVLALALRGTWCLHASAAMIGERLTVFLGESGAGKSTLAAYLVNNKASRWALVADDILPVTVSRKGLLAWPRFPQLKLPAQQQPGTSLPESLPVSRICVLVDDVGRAKPELKSIPSLQAAQVLLNHTAGTRLFDPGLLTDHLAFCAQAAKKAPMYQLPYTRQKAALPAIKQALERPC